MAFNILMFNQSWLAPELAALGHRVVTVGRNTPHLDFNFQDAEVAAADIIRHLPDGFSPDRIVYHDDSGTPWVVDLESLDIPKIFYSIDTHHHHQWHVLYAAIFERVLVAQSSYLSAFGNNSGAVFWFPPWAPITLEPAPRKTIEVCFRGTFDQALNPHRIEFFDKLSALIPGDFGPGDYTKAYPHARIVINQAVKNDLNFRVFEAMMCGALLITPADTVGLTDLFTPDEDLVLYQSGSPEDAAKQICRFLDDPKECERVAESGRKKILTHHTKEIRALELEQHLRALSGRTRAETLHHCAAESYLFSVFVAHQKSDIALPKMLGAAVSNLIRSVELKEPIQLERRLGFALLLGNKIRESRLGELEIDLFRALRAEYPAQFVVALGLIDAQLALGNLAEARRTASELVEAPDELIAQVPALMKQTRGDFWR
ncbi:MAG: glycosyltransferase [Bdellovibrionota bacterium]